MLYLLYLSAYQTYTLMSATHPQFKLNSHTLQLKIDMCRQNFNCSVLRCIHTFPFTIQYDYSVRIVCTFSYFSNILNNELKNGNMNWQMFVIIINDKL